MFLFFNIINLSGIARIYKLFISYLIDSLIGRLDAVYPSQTGGYSKKILSSMKIGNRAPKNRYSPYMLRITGISPYIPHIWVLLGGFGRVLLGMARYAPVLRVYLGLPVWIPNSIIIH
jgi:hypothetical protein